MFRLLSLLFTALMIAYAYFWVDSKHPELTNELFTATTNVRGDLQTLEVKFSVEQILKAHKRELMRDRRNEYLGAALKFYPYVLMEVKYLTASKRTKEALLLWDLTDGEIVINTKNWEKTHGLGDAITASANREDFQVLQTIHLRGGAADRETIARTLNLSKEIAEHMLESASKKHLVVVKSGKYKIHLDRPLLPLNPETRFTESLVTKPYRGALRTAPKFSNERLQKVAKELFGSDLVIRGAREIYLPVHAIAIQNPDGSLQTTHWNGLTGKKIAGN